ncbi:hypothetical protein OEB99_00390 [Actinotalea sp. M2MS4P-6]|uniref:hypothetical protein n=1 Tax=Actinotalea sp. M2MS4P-6 TaxID=2983762 RepID=UPI0021E5060E|nr:hypothetical protein [Actinotalea sp. M2MS4P-6]MCV2392756.1 hypothetical protein [Actinotalea sp. M2MS4P-6]
MPEQGFTRYQPSFENVTGSLDDFVVPPTVLARWAAMAGQLATAGCVPTQPAA